MPLVVTFIPSLVCTITSLTFPWFVHFVSLTRKKRLFRPTTTECECIGKHCANSQFLTHTYTGTLKLCLNNKDKQLPQKLHFLKEHDFLR